jgi:hypothetical protein
MKQGPQGQWAPTGDAPIPVAFNPQSLKIAYSNNVVTTPQSKTKVPPQKVSIPSAKLTLELLFDTSESGTDVRSITSPLAQIVAPGNTGSGPAPSGDAAPAPTDAGGTDDPKGISFQWNAFIFNGTLDSLDETLDYFAEDGTALRSTISLTITSHDFVSKPPAGQSATTGGGLAAGFSGTTPMAAVQVGASLQGMAASAGVSANWKSIAAANGIDNPLRLTAGASINLNARVSVGS